jgi:trigger factor
MLKLNLQQTDQKLLGDVTEFLIESTKFDLPAEFLKNGCKLLVRKNYLLKEAEVEYAF